MSKKQNLDAYLAEVFKQFIAIKDDDFRTSQEVFNNVFKKVKQKMGEQCNYFDKYSRQVLYAGSVYDGIKVSKMNEFDMDIVIKLPINYDDGPNGITIENDQPGFVRLKITNAFDNLDKQPDWEKCHKVIREWRDSDKYFLQNKFRYWMHGIVSKAMNELKGQVDVNGTVYLVTYKETGPAYTLNIRNDKGNEEFALDVDVVPVIRFMLPRWPEGYRMIEGNQGRNWLVVPKPYRAIKDGSVQNRCWRLSFQDYEKDIMKGSQAMKTTIRLVKKLRDCLELKYIASYYIKTLFLWEIDQAEDKTYWRNKLSVTFRGMVDKLYIAVKKKHIPYFWHKDNNLLEGVRPTALKTYEVKLKEVLDAIDANDVEKVVSYILTKDEMLDFKESEFYKRVSPVQTPSSSQEVPVAMEINGAGFLTESISALNDQLDSIRECTGQERIASFERRLTDLEGRMTRVETMMKLMAERHVPCLSAYSQDLPSNTASIPKSVFELSKGMEVVVSNTASIPKAVFELSNGMEAVVSNTASIPKAVFDLSNGMEAVVPNTASIPEAVVSNTASIPEAVFESSLNLSFVNANSMAKNECEL